MAFIDKRKGRKGVYVYYHESGTGKLKQLPRKLTKHLDNKPPIEAQAWLEDWEKSHGKTVDRANRIHLRSDERLQTLWSKYQSERAKSRKRREKTTESELGVFNNHFLPFFVGEHQNKNPETWHDLVPDFHTWLYSKGYKDGTIQKSLWTLERFGQFLVFQRIMSFPFSVLIPARENKKITPLKVRLTPETVLKFVQKYRPVKNVGRSSVITADEMKLAVLLSYFAALSPSELGGLEKESFFTGEYTEANSKTLAGFRAEKMGTLLSVAITKTISSGRDKKPVEFTKNDYRRAVVNIWNREAAILIANILEGRPKGRLFPLSYDGLVQAWNREVRPHLGTTIHDLRRSSALYLGRTKRISLTLLQEHMRHSEIETTMLYIREPSIPEKNEKVVQNFKAI